MEKFFQKFLDPGRDYHRILTDWSMDCDGPFHKIAEFDPVFEWSVNSQTDGGENITSSAAVIMLLRNCHKFSATCNWAYVIKLFFGYRRYDRC